MDHSFKIIRKKGFVLNNDDEELTSILNKIIVNQGHCITSVKNRNGHDQCPCSEYLQNNICHCNLYVKENEKD